MGDARGRDLRGPEWLVAAAWVLAALLAVKLSLYVVAGLQRPAHGFISHYTASRLLLEGEDVARFYDDAWFLSQVQRFEPTVTDLHGANLPTMSLLFVPLAPLDYGTARTLWTMSSLLLLVVTLVLVATTLDLGRVWTPIFIGFALVSQPVYENLLHGQVYVLALALLTLAWYGYRRGRERWVGVGLGALLIAKTAALMMWPLFLAQRMWRVLLWGGAVVAVVALGSLPWIGTAAWTRYLEVAREFPGSASLSVTAYQTELSFFRQLFVFDPVRNPQPAIDLPWLGHALQVVVSAALLGTALFLAVRRGASDLPFAGFVLLALILSPVSLDYHYVMALLPVAILLSRFRMRIARPAGLLLVAGALLIAADLPYRSLLLEPGWLAVLGYPKLYGAGLLWLLSALGGGVEQERAVTAAEAVAAYGERGGTPGFES